MAGSQKPALGEARPEDTLWEPRPGPLTAPPDEALLTWTSSRESDTAPSPVGLIFITMCNDCSKKPLFLAINGQRNKRSIN